MKTKKCDVLVMIWGMVGRDPQALIPVIYLLKEKYKLKVQVKSIFDYCAIDKLQPKILLTNGCIGSTETYKITKYAKNRGIHVVSLHAEGMFREKWVKNEFWGNNIEKKTTVDKWFLWSNRALNYTLKYYPYLKNVVEYSGATGFEKYLIFNKSDISKLNLISDKYESVILYTAWNFGVLKNYLDEKMQIVAEKYKKYVIECLTKIAVKYPNKLLILKYHPATNNTQETEISTYFNHFKNVLILKDEISIHKLILISDVLISFESSTTIDAWLSGKPTFNLFDGKAKLYSDSSTGIDDIREGSIVPETSKQLICLLDEYFTSGEIKEFNNKSNIRKEVIINNIGDIKSKPSIKIANYINDNLNKSNYPKGKLDLKIYFKGWLNRFMYNNKFLPNIPKTSNMRNYYEPELFDIQYKEFLLKLKDYYK